MRIHVALLSILCTITLHAQEFIPLSVSGFNADCVYESGETLSEQTAMDKNSWLLYSKKLKSSGGLATSITSKNYGIPYNFTSFSSNNTLLLNSNTSAYAKGTLLLDEPQQAEILFLLGLSADGGKDIKVTLTYTDNTTEEVQTINFHDWYGGKDISAHSGLGRISKNSGGYENRLDFSLFEAMLSVNSSKTIKNITCQAGDGASSYSSILAVTAVKGYTFSDEAPLFLINNSHLDTQWNWDITTTIDEYVKATLNDNLSRMAKYPSFRFNFEGAVKYQWMKEYYPNEYEKLKNYIAEGRWNPSGGAWDANETMVASSESLLRNLLYGQQFYKKEFGKKGGTDIMLPDCFGFSAALPSIASHCGFTGFHTQKLTWGSAYNYDELPAFGKWKGIDGSEIYCILKPGAYDKTFNENLSFSTGMYSDIKDNESKYGLKANFRYTGKMGDRGGALSEENAEWLEKSINGKGPVRVQLVSPTEAFEYMKAHDNGQYKTVNHELPMRTHGVGCYTSQTMMKYWNRRNELMGDAAERSSLIADWIGAINYPKNTLTEAWKRVILHQFHDDLPGTSIPKAYYYSHNDELLSLQDFHRTTHLAVSAVADRMNTATEHTPIVVYNSLSIEREDIVEGEVSSTQAWKGIRVKDAEGNDVACQLTKFSEGKQGFIFAGKVPSLGYAVYDIEELFTTEHKEDSTFTVSNNQLENDKYRVTLNEQTGDIKSIYDKSLKQEMLSMPLRLALLPCKSTTFPAWEIPYNTLTGTATYVNNTDGTLHISIAEDGPLRKSLRIERTRLGSTFVQYVQLTKAGASDRLDIINEIDWQSKGYLLKLDATLRANNVNATFDNSLGHIQRGNSTSDFYEYPAHQWVDLTNTAKTYGVSILNDCKYGWDKPANNRLRMSIVYSPEVDKNYPYQHLQDIGFNRFTYSIFTHKGTFTNETMWHGQRLNSPLMAYATQKHEGPLGQAFSFVQLNTNDVAIKAFKQAEEDDAAIVRLQELTGRAQEAVTLTFPSEILHAEEVNGLEEYKGIATYNSNTLTLKMDAFGLKTLKIRLAKNSTNKEGDLDVPDSSFTCELTYNADVISLDERKNDGTTGTMGHLFPGELLSDTLFDNGITFKLGPSTAAQKNAVQCKGQSILLPKDHKGGKLHLLAFSSDERGTLTTFDIDGEKYDVQIGYAMGMMGTWGSEYTPSVFRNENVAFTATHSHHISERKNKSYQYMYLMHYALDIKEGATTFTLPESSKVYLMAATVAKSPTDLSSPLLPTQHLFPTAIDVPSYNASCGKLLVPSAVSASGYTGTTEMPKYAADLNPYTKWCDNKSSSKWILYNFGKEVEICQWEIILAASENLSYTARDMRLQYYDKETAKYVDLDVVNENESNHLLRGVTPIVTQKMRLQVESPEQSGQTARIYTLNFYGRDATETGIGTIEKEIPEGPHPIYDLSGRRVGIAMIREGKLHHPLLPSGIYIVNGKKFSLR